VNLDEARYGFVADASPTVNTYNYMFVGDNIEGHAFAATELVNSTFRDLDTYSIFLNIGSSYTIVASQLYQFSPDALNTLFALLDRTGNVLALSTDSVYYVQYFTDCIGL
jgi:hypothetical protein